MANKKKGAEKAASQEETAKNKQPVSEEETVKSEEAESKKAEDNKAQQAETEAAEKAKQTASNEANTSEEKKSEEPPEIEEKSEDEKSKGDKSKGEKNEKKDPTQDLQKALENATNSLAAKEKDYLYLMAEYQNFRKRSATEKTNAYNSAKADAVVAFLPVYDNLQRALATPCADEAFRKGVEMTMNQMNSVLEKLGLTKMDCVNKPFDPNTENAVMHVEDEAYGENMVIEVFQDGFKLGDKVVREAMVKVAN